MRSFSLFLAALALTMLTIGCGGPKLYPVQGTVTLDGKPVSSATVSFMPNEETDGRQANGLTDDTGHFTLTTHPDGNGARAGTYKVLVTKFEIPPVSMGSTMRADAMSQSANTPQKSLLPEKYGTLVGTDLTVTVPTTGAVELKLSRK